MARRAQDALALFAREDRTPGAPDAGGVQVLRVVVDVEHQYLFRDPIQDVLRRPRAALAGTLVAAQFFGQPAQARYLVGTENASNARV